MFSVLSNFILMSIGVSVIILIVLFMKKSLNHHISPYWQYNIDLILAAILLIPILPSKFLRFSNLTEWLTHRSTATATISEGMVVQNQARSTFDGYDWMQDFSVSVTRFMPERYLLIFTIVWLAGAMAFGVVLYLCSHKLRLVRESVKLSAKEQLNQLFLKAKSELNIKRKVSLGTSVLVKSPMTIGVFKPLIILPFDITKHFDERDMHHIFLHELVHCKRRDSLINNLLCLLQVIYWFNPLMYITFRKIREDREIACDFSVLNCLPAKSNILYGETVIGFAQRLSRRKTFSLSMELGSTKRQLTKRIEKIAVFKSETKFQRIKSAVIFTLIMVLILGQVPIVTALATTTVKDEYYEFNEHNVQYEDLSSYFGDYEGSFVLYDLDSSEYTIYNETVSTKRVSPASTYKIYSGLIALEEGVITPQSLSLRWDGSVYPIKAWNRDQDLMSAIQNSVNWYFQSIDRLVGKEKLNSWFELIAYGNHDLSGSIDTYWMASSLKISPIEQVKLLTSLYRNDTAFKPDNVARMKSILRLSEHNGAALSGKTGTIKINSSMKSGWFLGYVEKDGHTSVFTVYIDGDNASGSQAAKIALSILADKRIY